MLIVLNTIFLGILIKIHDDCIDENLFNNKIMKWIFSILLTIEIAIIYLISNEAIIVLACIAIGCFISLKCKDITYAIPLIAVALLSIILWEIFYQQWGYVIILILAFAFDEIFNDVLLKIGKGNKIIILICKCRLFAKICTFILSETTNIWLYFNICLSFDIGYHLAGLALHRYYLKVKGK